MPSRSTVLDTLADALTTALLPVPLERDRTLDVDDIVEGELPLAVLHDAGEESSPPERSPRGRGLKHQTAVSELHLYGGKGDDLPGLYEAALAALEGPQLGRLLDADPSTELELVSAPDGAPYRAAVLTARLPYHRS